MEPFAFSDLSVDLAVNEAFHLGVEPRLAIAIEGWAEEESEVVSMKLKSPQQKVGRVPEMEHILLRRALCNLTLSGPVGK